MKMQTVRMVRDMYPAGSAPHVVVHGWRQKRRGRKPAMAYRKFTNPLIAYEAANRDALFYDIAVCHYGSLHTFRANTMIIIDKKYQPLRLRHAMTWLQAIDKKAPDGLSMSDMFTRTLLARAIETEVTDAARCYEDILDVYYSQFNNYILHYAEELLSQNNYSVHEAMLDTYDAFYCSLLDVCVEVASELDAGFTNLRIRDMDISLN